VIGVSCHDSSHLAMEAGDDGADYVAFGAFYATNSKEPEKLAKYGTPETDMLKWWYTYTVIPCVAIGGMRPDNCAPQVIAGADFIAAIQAVWDNPKGPKAAVQAFNREIAQALKSRPQPELAA
jgi:thiamine-phosphate pyrophosphorylase